MRRERQVQLLAGAIFIVMALVAAVPFWLGRSIGIMTHESHQGLARQLQLDQVLDLLRDAESGQRGFLLTGKDTFLEPYAQAQRQLPRILAQLKQQSRSDDERATVWRIARLVELKQAEMDETVAARREAGLAAAERVVASLRGKHDMDELRRLIGAETGRLQGQRDVLRAQLLAASDDSFLVSLGATLVNICVLGTLLVVLMRMLRERHASARLLSERAAQLEAAAEQAARHNRELLVIAEMRRQQSLLDPLTGLFNRRYFDETLKRELVRAERKAMPLSLLVLDIDHFKRVNDSFGHAAGDAVLRTMAQQIRAWTREGDVACRYGGEEFVVLLPECGVEVSTARAERLREAIEATLQHADGVGPERVTVSVGVAEYPSHGAEAESLFWAADKALYRAKQTGRNRVVTVGD